MSELRSFRPMARRSEIKSLSALQNRGNADRGMRIAEQACGRFLRNRGRVLSPFQWAAFNSAFLFRNPRSAIRISHLLGCTFAATFSRSPFKEMNPVASDWL